MLLGHKLKFHNQYEKMYSHKPAGPLCDGRWTGCNSISAGMEKKRGLYLEENWMSALEANLEIRDLT